MQPADVNAWFRLFSIAVHQARPELALRLLDNVCAVMAQISRDQKARSSTLNALECVAFWLGGEAGYGARVHDAWLAAGERCCQ